MLRLSHSSLRRRGLGTMPPLRREPTRPKAASVPQAMICMPLPNDAQLTCAGPSLQTAVTAPPTPQHYGQMLNPKTCGIHDDAPIHWPSKNLRRQIRESSSQQRNTPASADPAGWSKPGMQGSRSIPTHTHGAEPPLSVDLFRDVPLLHRPGQRTFAQ